MCIPPWIVLLEGSGVSSPNCPGDVTGFDLPVFSCDWSAKGFGLHVGTNVSSHNGSVSHDPSGWDGTDAIAWSGSVACLQVMQWVRKQMKQSILFPISGTLFSGLRFLKQLWRSLTACWQLQRKACRKFCCLESVSGNPRGSETFRKHFHIFHAVSVRQAATYKLEIPQVSNSQQRSPSPRWADISTDD